MDIALVEHPEHDIDGEDRGGDEQRLDCSEAWKACAVPWNEPLSVAGAQIAFDALTLSTAWPSDTPGARLKDSVTAGNWPWWLTEQRLDLALNGQWR